MANDPRAADSGMQAYGLESNINGQGAPVYTPGLGIRTSTRIGSLKLYAQAEFDRDQGVMIRPG